MKIIHVIAYYGDYLGGLQNYVKELAKRQKAEGHEVKIITSNLYGFQKKVDGIKIIRCKAWFSAFRVPFTPSLPIKLLKEKCDVVHAHLPLPGMDLSVALKKLLSPKTKLILTIHNDLQINSITSRIFGWIHNKILIKIPICLSNSVITTTKSFTDDLKYKIPLKKHKVIPLGVDTNLFRDLGLKRENKILFVGRMIPEKGLHLLVDAINQVKYTIPDVKLIIAHQRVYNYNEYYNKIKKEGKGFIIEKENCKPKDLVKLYNQCKCLGIASLQESFGLIFLESLACNCPVVSFNLPGPKEALKNKVNWVPLGNVDKLADEIEKALKSKDKINSRGFVKNNFSWDKINKQILEVYEE